MTWNELEKQIKKMTEEEKMQDVKFIEPVDKDAVVYVIQDVATSNKFIYENESNELIFSEFPLEENDLTYVIDKDEKYLC